MGSQDVFAPDEIERVATLGLEWTLVLDAVVLIVTRAKQGTGLLIASDLVLTARHVVPEEAALDDAGVRQGMYGQNSGKRLSPRPSRYFYTSAVLDYTVFGVDPVTLAVPLDLGTAARPRVGQRVRVLGHRDGEPLEVSGPDGAVQSVDGAFVEYTADTEDGMSGGPVLDSARRLLAIHHFGDHDGDSSNRGVLATAIREDLK